MKLYQKLVIKPEYILELLGRIATVEIKLNIAYVNNNFGLMDCYTVQLREMKEELKLLTRNV